MMSETKKSWKDKASTQNVVAFIVILSTTFAAIYAAKWELVSIVVGAALVYLFPKKEET
jgi:hypothetical protein